MREMTCGIETHSYGTVTAWLQVGRGCDGGNGDVITASGQATLTHWYLSCLEFFLNYFIVVQ